MLTTILCLSLLVSVSALVVSLQRNIVYMEKIDEITVGIQSALDVLDEQYQSIDKKTKIEVFSDEPVVRNLVQDLVQARNSVLIVARLLDETVEFAAETERKAEEK